MRALFAHPSPGLADWEGMVKQRPSPMDSINMNLGEHHSIFSLLCAYNMIGRLGINHFAAKAHMA